LGRRAVRAATGPQEIEEQPFEVEVLAARRAVGEVLTDLLLHLRGQLAVEVFVQVFGALAAVHVALPLMYPIPTAQSYNLACSMRRARNSRDFTVPTGTSTTRAISSYDSPSTSLNTTVSRNCSGNSSIARSTSSSTIRSKNVPWGSSSCS